MIKPSEQAPSASALLAELIPKYLDPELYHVVNGGVPEVTKVGILRFRISSLSDSVSLVGARAALGSQCVYRTGPSPVWRDADPPLHSSVYR